MHVPTLTLTRRKPENPGFVETPGRTSRLRRSATPNAKTNGSPVGAATSALSDDNIEVQIPTKPGKSNGVVTENFDGTSDRDDRYAGVQKQMIDGWEEGKDPRVDYSGHFEFGGSWGVSAMMIGFPCLMW